MAKSKEYVPKYKIDDLVMDRNPHSTEIGIIKLINNYCNVRDNNRLIPEYYVHWPKGSWTRYDCEEVDNGECTLISVLGEAGKILYGNKRTKVPSRTGTVRRKVHRKKNRNSSSR